MIACKQKRRTKCGTPLYCMPAQGRPYPCRAAKGARPLYLLPVYAVNEKEIPF